jgi:hypothetical protein
VPPAVAVTSKKERIYANQDWVVHISAKQNMFSHFFSVSIYQSNCRIIPSPALLRKLAVGAFTPLVAWDVEANGIAHAYRGCALLLATIPPLLLHFTYTPEGNDAPQFKKSAQKLD